VLCDNLGAGGSGGVGALCVRARGVVVSFARPKLQLEGVRVGLVFFETVLLSMEGVGVKELCELAEEVGGDSFLKGKGRRERDLGFDQWSGGVMEW
jgi:hypothetical protein